MFFGTGNILVALILLVIAFLLPAKPKKIKALSSRDALTPVKRIWQTAVKSKEAVAIHQGLVSEVSNSKRFSQILNANLHFLVPLTEKNAITLMHEASLAAIEGNRKGSVEKLITELAPEITKEEIDSLSVTAMSKVLAAITQTRAERIECTWYIWRTCQDERVRASHAQMEGVICSFLTPPRPESLIGEPDLGAYNPGESRECRCYAEPIVDPDFETWPQKVVLNGKLVDIDARKFKVLARDMSCSAKL